MPLGIGLTQHGLARGHGALRVEIFIQVERDRLRAQRARGILNFGRTAQMGDAIGVAVDHALSVNHDGTARGNRRRGGVRRWTGLRRSRTLRLHSDFDVVQ